MQESIISNPELIKIIGTIFAISYLIGSIPFGLIIGKLFLKQDIRQQGSGNIGATNAARAGGKKFGAIILLLDAAKGAIALLFCHIFIDIKYFYYWEKYQYSPPPWVEALNTQQDAILLIVFLAVIIGHIFPIWLRFKGGKGVATFLGAILYFHLSAAICFATIWLLSFKIWRISALSAIISLTITSIFLCIQLYLDIDDAHYAISVYMAITLIIIYRHKDNIKRMLSKAEHKF